MTDDRDQHPDERSDNPAASICRRLVALRLRHYGPRGRRQFASELGIPLSTYCTYEKNRTAPADLLVKAAHITGCELNWLMTGVMGNLPEHNLSDHDAEIVKRLMDVIADRPEARPSIEAFIDLLSTTTHRPPAAAPKRHAVHVIPIIGRVAAGKLARWGDTDDEMVRNLETIVREVEAHGGPNVFTGMVTVADQHDDVRKATVVRFSQPYEIGAVSIDGVIKVVGEHLRSGLVAMEIDGQSMEPMLSQGDFVLADSKGDVRAGQAAIISVTGQIGATCKMIVGQGGDVRLVAANPTVESVKIDHASICIAWPVIAVVRRR